MAEQVAGIRAWAAERTVPANGAAAIRLRTVEFTVRHFCGLAHPTAHRGTVHPSHGETHRDT